MVYQLIKFHHLRQFFLLKMSNQSSTTSADIDRSKVCPFLLRCFWNINRKILQIFLKYTPSHYVPIYILCCNNISFLDHNYENDYNNTINDVYPKNEVQIYTWKDATLREISDLIRGLFSVNCLSYN